MPLERIQEIDIIRGFALFGVLWLNLVAHGHNLVPSGTFDDLPSAPLDALIEPVADMFIANKAMALFSLLFGYGFAMIIRRLEARQADAGRIFLRRTAILFAIGIIHIWFIWFGDILHVYALMGFVLYLTRNWSDRSLLVVGLFLALFSTGVVEAILQFLYDEPFPWTPIYDIALERHFEVLQGNNYPAYVGELWWASWKTMWGTPYYINYCTIALGRFMLGAWIFRQGWLQSTTEYRLEFRRWSAVLIGGGIVLTFAGYGIERFNDVLGLYIRPVTTAGIGTRLRNCNCSLVPKRQVSEGNARCCGGGTYRSYQLPAPEPDVHLRPVWIRTWLAKRSRRNSVLCIGREFFCTSDLGKVDGGWRGFALDPRNGPGARSHTANDNRFVAPRQTIPSPNLRLRRRSAFGQKETFRQERIRDKFSGILVLAV